AGVYTVGDSTADFGSLNEAVSALQQRGAVDTVSFNVLDGQYEEQINLENLNGISQSVPLIIQSQSGNPASVVFSQPSGLVEYHIFRFREVSGVVLRNVSIKVLGYDRVDNLVLLDNGATHILLDGVHLNGNYWTYEAGRLLTIINGSYYTTHDITIKNCEFRNGNRSIVANGAAYQSVHYNWQLISNSFVWDESTDPYSALYFDNIDSLVLDGNTIEFLHPTNALDFSCGTQIILR
ncbi:MAG: hypothetical protein AAFQ98_24660, partial [Bacteroidota bacterium]